MKVEANGIPTLTSLAELTSSFHRDAVRCTEEADN